MKRSDALAPLSRDHHKALFVALQLRRAEAETVAEAAERFEAFLADQGRLHFSIEEALLLPALPASDPEWGRGCARVLADHERLRAGVPDGADVESVRAMGELLADHVRFEERELFEILERRLDPAELERLGRAVAEAERR